ncbi:MAG: DUF1311 domain-containing protein [Alphaproteobacteria bacterium]|nr:DUF1311 domain-containing protein [Alphaproteobacteria bacterium]NNF25295.1 DUF1311 domain-containing protein [Paracoccaceae bacterium]
MRTLCILGVGALALGLVVLGPPAARAADPRFTPDATEACLADAVGRAAKTDCVGQSANACMTHPDGANTAVIGFCLGQEAQLWDTRLNDAFAELLPLERALDDSRPEGWSLPSRAKALRHMQRDWIRFRDTACQYSRLRYDSGSLANSAQLACLMRLTARQALDLEAVLEEVK